MRWPSGRMTSGRALAAVLLALGALGPRAPVSAGPPDRLERFRELARGRRDAPAPDADDTADAARRMYALVDAEIVDSLAAGGPFASIAFLQDRLDAFADAWGEATLDVVGVDGLVVGAFQLSETSETNTVRVYGRLRGEPRLLSAFRHEGRPRVSLLPAGPRGEPQFLAAWEGPPSGRGTRALRLDLVRAVGDGPRVVWSTGEALAGSLGVSWYEVRGVEVRVRHELRYPGWTPGCAAQTEAEDLLRLTADGGAFARVHRAYRNAWHRDLHAAASRVFDALAAGDAPTLARLVPDARLRGRLPAGLAAEAACDTPDGAAVPRAVAVAAREGRVPWTIVFQRRADGWWLVRAEPVLQ